MEGFTVSQHKLCKAFGYSRQGYYKNVKRHTIREKQKTMLLNVVREIRIDQPRAGVRKMHEDINDRLILERYPCIGRDRLFDILRENDFLVKPIKRFTRTTYSHHRFRTYKNVLKKTVQTGPNQAFVADITYLRLPDKFCFLSLVTDVYSRKIVGYHLSSDLKANGTIKALKMALKQTPNTKGIIHHSDRGIQYCCDAYTQLLQKKEVAISMTEENHCYENAMAERVNETLKYDLLLGEILPNFEIAKKMVKQAVNIYNKKRRHVALGYVTPEKIHAA